ncbi:MAG: sugar phosphate nucleotidyltransferase [Egibacteraceae bacterium]
MHTPIQSGGRNNMADVQAVILAGGKGTRLRPVTVDLPKPLVPIANRPLVVHQLIHLASSGVTDVTLALGYNAERFRGVEAEAERRGINLRIVTEPVPLGTGGALRYAFDQGAFDDRPLLWINGDVVATPSVRSLTSFHANREALVTFWLSSVRDVSEFGVLEVAEDGRVERFVEKPAPEETDSRLINAGILVLDPRLLERIPADRFFSFEKNLLPALVEGREPIYGRFDGGYWLDTGRPKDFLMANRHVLEGRVQWWPAGNHTGGDLWEGEDCKCEGARVIQPAVLGDECVVEQGAQLFGRTVLGNRVTVRDGAQLEDCVVFDDVEICEDAVIVDAIVCAGARIEAGAVVAGSIVGARAVVGEGNQLRGARLWSDVQLPKGALIVG